MRENAMMMLTSGVKWMLGSWSVLLAYLFTMTQIAQPPASAFLLSELSRVNSVLAVPATVATQFDMQRQIDKNTNDIDNLKRRQDILDAIHIESNIATMKATIEIDHMLMVATLGALLLLVLKAFTDMYRAAKKGP